MSKTYRISRYTPTQTISKCCAVCNTTTATRLLKIENNLNIIICEGCDFVFVNPRPVESELNRFYQEYYPDAEEIPESWKQEMSSIFDEAMELIHQHRKGGRILDIGCSYGFFISSFSGQVWERVGVEPSKTATDYLSSHYEDIAVTTANFESVDYGPGSFDVITAFYVLEHVLDPREFMEKVYALLRPDGIAIIRIPYSRPFFGISNLLGRPLLQAPMHLSDFSPAQLTAMSRDIGFGEVSTYHGAHRYSVDFIEKTGATIMAAVGKTVEFVSGGRVTFPFYGAYSYLLKKS